MAKNNMKTPYSLCYFFTIASFCTKQSQKCWDQRRDVERGEVVVEYKDERVDMEEGTRKDERYAEAQRRCTLIDIDSARQQVAYVHGASQCQLGCHLRY